MKKIVVGVMGFLLLAGSTTVIAGSMSDDLMMELKNLVERQQKQLDAQASEIARLKEQMALVTGKTQTLETAEPAVANAVVKGNKSAEVQLYGHVNRAVLWADDGNSSKAYFVDNYSSMTRLGIKGNVQATEDFSVGTWIEYGVTTNPSSTVNQLDESTFAGNIIKRQLDLYLQSKTYGKLSLGFGSTASDSTSEVDLSGTMVTDYSDITYVAGGYYFYDTRNKMLSDVQVRNVFTNMDGLSRLDRIKYESPSFSGFSIGGSYGSNYIGDVALHYNREFSGAKFASAVAWASPGDYIPTVDNQFNGSFSVLLENGLNATVAGGIQTMKESGRDDANFWYAKLGYQAKPFKYGQSNFAVNYTQTNSLSMNDDTGSSFGLVFVQNIKDWGTELYLQYRWHELDRTGESYDNINAIMSGARVKF